jgi:hypothetical protein
VRASHSRRVLAPSAWRRYAIASLPSHTSRNDCVASRPKPRFGIVTHPRTWPRGVMWQVRMGVAGPHHPGMGALCRHPGPGARGIAARRDRGGVTVPAAGPAGRV